MEKAQAIHIKLVKAAVAVSPLHPPAIAGGAAPVDPPELPPSMSNQLLFSSTSMDAAKAAFWNGVLAPCRLLLLAYAVETEDMAVLPNWSPDLGSSQKFIFFLDGNCCRCGSSPYCCRAAVG